MNTRERMRIGLGLAVAVASAYVMCPYRVGVVVGNSMSPSMRSGSFYLLDRRQHKQQGVRRGDVVVFRKNGTTFIKRVLATPGDMVYVLRYPEADDDMLVMDWELEGVQRLARRPTSYAAKLIRRRVPPGSYYVLGDHLSASVDSREFGPVEQDQILGRVVDAPERQPLLEHVAGIYRIPSEAPSSERS